MTKTIVTVAACAALLWASTAQATASAQQKCEAAKLNAAAKYAACRLGAEKKAVLKAIAPDYMKCDAKQLAAWTKAEAKYSVACPSSGDQAAIQIQVTQDGAAVAAELAGTPLCGNGAIDPEEQCDGANLQGETCANLGYSGGTLACNGSCQFNTAGCTAGGVLKTGQTTSYGAGSDGDLQKGASRSYTDNGDGTITDNRTGLMWEKKDQSLGGIHNWNNVYTWGMETSPYTMNGTMVTTFLATLNAGSGFAGHTDWRIPNRFELESLVNLQNVLPAVDAAFNTNCLPGCAVTSCSCTAAGYWSSTTYQGSPASAWNVVFADGLVIVSIKSGAIEARAVRGGS